MARPPMHPVAGGGWVAATDPADLPALADLMARYLAREAAAERHRDAIRAGTIPPDPPAETWHVSDRH